MVRPYIIAVYAYLSVVQVAMALQHYPGRTTVEVKSDGTQIAFEEHDSNPDAQEVIRAEEKAKVDTTQSPGDAPFERAEVMLEINADGNVRVQPTSLVDGSGDPTPPSSTSKVKGSTEEPKEKGSTTLLSNHLLETEEPEEKCKCCVRWPQGQGQLY